MYINPKNGGSGGGGRGLFDLTPPLVFPKKSFVEKG